MGESVESRIGYQMKRAQQALRAEMDRVLREVGLTTPQYAALSAIEETPGLSGADLARRGFVTPQTMNQILVNLEAAGLVLRRPHAEHGRVLQAYLTRKGERSVSAGHEAVEEIERRMVAGLSPDQRDGLYEALHRCVDALESSG